MSAKIIRTFKEQLPSVRFVGKCYSDGDRVNGNFGAKWRELMELKKKLEAEKVF